jgi:hypothetical protein
MKQGVPHWIGCSVIGGRNHLKPKLLGQPIAIDHATEGKGEGLHRFYLPDEEFVEYRLDLPFVHGRSLR